jgi:hypothetical protein
MSTVEFAKLPYIRDPLGRYWRQPAGLRDRVRIYADHATLSAEDWAALPRYDTSIPSGYYAGKAWRRGPLLCWFGRDKLCFTRAVIQTQGGAA